MKKALKLIAIIFGLLFTAIIIFGVLLLKKLPSAWDIKQAVVPKKMLHPEFVQPKVPQQNSEVENSPADQSEKPALKKQEAIMDESKLRSMKILKDDFMNEQKPLSSVCAHLAQAEKSHFLRKDESASAEQFTKSLTDPDNKDPLVESASPVLRFLFRVDGMHDLITMIEKASAENDQGILKKAEFYTKLGVVGQNIRASKDDINRILMKSYNLFALSKAVGKHPELARDPATLSFCEQIEKNLNMNLEYNADDQAAEMMKFLDYAKVDPKEVDFDPSYRSNVNFNFSGSNLQITHTWIEKLFEKDIAKARKHLDSKSTEHPAPSNY